MMRLSASAKKAFSLGSMYFLAYLAVYVARNILGSVSPRMIADGVFTESQIGTLSSICFIAYAVGQLINGIVGDMVKGKYMISFGLILAGLCNGAFSLFSSQPLIRLLAYTLSGFALAMIYGPMTKIVAENTEPVYTPRCSLGFTFASFLGAPIAGILAAFFVWQGVFFASSGILLLMGAVCLIVFTCMEHKGLVTYGNYSRPKESGGSIRLLIRRRIISFTVIAMLTGMVSGATGFLVFSSYMAAAVSSARFSNAVTVIGWGPLILIWCGLMALGFLVCLHGHNRGKMTDGRV